MAEDALALSLDDIIKRNRDKQQPKSKARDEGGRRGRGAGRRNGGTTRTAVVSTVQTKRTAVRGRRGGASGTFRDYDGTLFEDKEPAPGRPKLDLDAASAVFAALEGNASWKHDKYEGGPRRKTVAKGRGVSKQAVEGYKLLIENLDYKVNDEDIKELFESFGGLKHSTVHWGNDNRSKGTAEVIYKTREAAMKAQKQYNGVALDGKPMMIELVSADAPGTSTLTSGLRVGGGGGGGRPAQRLVTASRGGRTVNVARDGGRRTGRHLDRDVGDMMQE